MERQLEQVYAGSGLVRFEYKDLAFIGNESIRAAEAAACANEQGQYWPYHHTIFANQRGENLGAFNDEALKAFAAAISLDQEAFDGCLDSNRYRNTILQAANIARDRGVSSTPTVFLNGQLVEGQITFSRLQQLIEIALAGSN